MKKIIKVKGMHCTGCENRLKNALITIPNVTKVDASFKKGEVTITSKEEIADEILFAKITDLGFEIAK